MGTLTGAFTELLEVDLRKLQNNIAKYTVQEMADDLTEEARIAIEDFYGDYTPIYYLRHNNFYRSFKRYYKNSAPRYIGGIELLQDSIPNVYRGTDSSPQSVFKRVYSGLHGIASLQGRTPITNPSPMERIEKKYEEILNNSNAYFRRATSKALRDGYNIIS